MFSIGIVALSLVPLVGFAGQISLCQLSFAGIGALVMAHLGAGGNPLGLVAAVVICALVGGLVALPALRLSGHLHGAGHRRVRRAARSVDLRAARLELGAAAHQHLLARAPWTCPR